MAITPEIVGWIITGLIGLIILLGYLSGLIRGLNKSFYRFVWFLCIGIALFVVTPYISRGLFDLDLSFVGASVGGAPLTSISAVVKNFFQSTPEIANIIEDNPELLAALLKMASLVLNSILFVLLFWILKYLTLPFFWIFGKAKKNKKTKEQKAIEEQLTKLNKTAGQASAVPSFIVAEQPVKKRRALGSLIGLATGCLIAVFTFIPFIGVTNLVNDLNKIEVETTGGETSGLVELYVPPMVMDYLDGYEQSLGAKVFKYTGMDFLADSAFGLLTTATINDYSFSLTNEAKIYASLYSKAQKYITLDFKSIDQETLNTMITDAKFIADGLFDSGVLSALGSELLPSLLMGLSENTEITVIDIEEINNAIKSALGELSKLNMDALKADLLNAVEIVDYINKIEDEYGESLLLKLITNDMGNIVEVINLVDEDDVTKVIDLFLNFSTINTILPIAFETGIQYLGDACDFVVDIPELEFSGDVQTNFARIFSSIYGIVESVNLDEFLVPIYHKIITNGEGANIYSDKAGDDLSASGMFLKTQSGNVIKIKSGQRYNLNWTQSNSGEFLKVGTEYYEIITSGAEANTYTMPDGGELSADGGYLKTGESTYVEIVASNRYKKTWVLSSSGNYLLQEVFQFNYNKIVDVITPDTVKQIGVIIDAFLNFDYITDVTYTNATAKLKEFICEKLPAFNLPSAVEDYITDLLSNIFNNESWTITFEKFGEIFTIGKDVYKDFVEEVDTTDTMAIINFAVSNFEIVGAILDKIDESAFMGTIEDILVVATDYAKESFAEFMEVILSPDEIDEAFEWLKSGIYAVENWETETTALKPVVLEVLNMINYEGGTWQDCIVETDILQKIGRKLGTYFNNGHLINENVISKALTMLKSTILGYIPENLVGFAEIVDQLCLNANSVINWETEMKALKNVFKMIYGFIEQPYYEILPAQKYINWVQNNAGLYYKLDNSYYAIITSGTGANTYNLEGGDYTLSSTGAYIKIGVGYYEMLTANRYHQWVQNNGGEYLQITIPYINKIYYMQINNDNRFDRIELPEGAFEYSQNSTGAFLKADIMSVLLKTSYLQLLGEQITSNINDGAMLLDGNLLKMLTKMVLDYADTEYASALLPEGMEGLFDTMQSAIDEASNISWDIEFKTLNKLLQFNFLSLNFETGAGIKDLGILLDEVKTSQFLSNGVIKTLMASVIESLMVVAEGGVTLTDQEVVINNSLNTLKLTLENSEINSWELELCALKELLDIFDYLDDIVNNLSIFGQTFDEVKHTSLLSVENINEIMANVFTTLKTSIIGDTADVNINNMFNDMVAGVGNIGNNPEDANYATEYETEFGAISELINQLEELESITAVESIDAAAIGSMFDTFRSKKIVGNSGKHILFVLIGKIDVSSSTNLERLPDALKANANNILEDEEYLLSAYTTMFGNLKTLATKMASLTAAIDFTTVDLPVLGTTLDEIADLALVDINGAGIVAVEVLRTVNDKIEPDSSEQHIAFGKTEEELTQIKTNINSYIYNINATPSTLSGFADFNAMFAGIESQLGLDE